MFYVGLAGVLYPLGCCIELGAHWADFIYRGALLALYVFVVMRREHLSCDDNTTKVSQIISWI